MEDVAKNNTLQKPIVYGIPNCDITKKTMDWFKKNKTAVIFHDYKVEGITKEKLTEWSKKISWEILLNKKSSTWRGIPVSRQEKITNHTAAIALMLEHNSIIKRPVIEYGDQLLVGFNEEAYKGLLNIPLQKKPEPLE